MVAIIVLGRGRARCCSWSRSSRSASCGRTSAASSSGSGRYHATADPGLRLIIPFVDRMILVDMREQVVEVPAQEVITSDNVVVTVYAVVYYEATDAQRLLYNVANFELAVDEARADQPAQPHRRPRRSTRR